MPKLWSSAAIVVLLAAAAALAGCATGGGGQQRRGGLAEPTARPGTPSAADATAARDQLAALDPRLGAVADAVAGADIDGLLALLFWQQAVCGQRRDTACGRAAPGDTIAVANAGGGEPFYAPAELLRPALARVLAEKPLTLRFAAQSKATPALVYLGFGGPEVKGYGMLPFADPTMPVTGLWVTADMRRNPPVVLLVPGIADVTSAATEIAGGFADIRLILFDPVLTPTAGAPASAKPSP